MQEGAEKMILLIIGIVLLIIGLIDEKQYNEETIGTIENRKRYSNEWGTDYKISYIVDGKVYILYTSTAKLIGTEKIAIKYKKKNPSVANLKNKVSVLIELGIFLIVIGIVYIIKQNT